MKQLLISILFILLTLTIKSQDKRLIDFIAICNEDNIENIYQLKRQVIAYDLNFKLLSIELVVKLNCAQADTGFIKFSNDSLFLFTDFKYYSEIINGEKLIVKEEADCDCAFNLSYDIFGFSTLPQTILINGQPIELNNVKYLSGESQLKNGIEELISDDCGFLYRTIYFKSGTIKKIFREKGIKNQSIEFDEKGDIIEISTYKGDLDNVITVKLK